MTEPCVKYTEGHGIEIGYLNRKNSGPGMAIQRVRNLSRLNYLRQLTKVVLQMEQMAQGLCEKK